jgi:hypothetical protein
MIILNTQDREKIALLDTLFETMDLESLKTLVGREQVVSALKGATPMQGLLTKSIDDFNFIFNDAINTRSAVEDLKRDFRDLLKIVNGMHGPIPTQLEYLKSKYGAY